MYSERLRGSACEGVNIPRQLLCETVIVFATWRGPKIRVRVRLVFGCKKLVFVRLVFGKLPRLKRSLFARFLCDSPETLLKTPNVSQKGSICFNSGLQEGTKGRGLSDEVRLSAEAPTTRPSLCWAWPAMALRSSCPAGVEGRRRRKRCPTWCRRGGGSHGCVGQAHRYDETTGVMSTIASLDTGK